MNIFVCIKQVPDSSEVKINPETGTLIRAGVPSILNPYDHFAIVAALNIKKNNPDAVINVITMGPPQAKAVLQLALALGCDNGYLLSDVAFAGSDTWATSYALSQGIKKIGKADLIICGMQAIDGDTAQVGPGIASQLNIPQITFCDNVDLEGKKVIAKRHIDDGYDIVEANTPCVVTMVMPKDYELPFPSFVDIHKASSKTIITYSADDIGAKKEYIGLKGSPTQVNRIYPPSKEVKTTVINTTSVEAVEKIIEIMKQENFIK
ncbi:MAG: electron transfer flavoprotein subunit beta/FixA family protein [Elusimicrobiota bacterium]|nr:electron transfer flavoprotein subunit beta/FixA family protein [Elusimicrobiales bacterium]HPO94872.1 electron transfer flavoprotein subunit beta/FixA family protein [Elusimicrobiales bacterium]